MFEILYPTMNITLRVNFFVYPDAVEVVQPRAIIYEIPKVPPARVKQASNQSFFPKEPSPFQFHQL